MSMEPILSEVYLDVYDHDTTPTTIKAIALDSQTRFVQAYLQKYGEVYNPDLNATVNLIALRPDKVGVEGDGEIVMLVPPGEDSEEPIYEEQEVEGEIVQVQTGTRVISGDPAIYGVKAEITQAMLAVEGIVLLQFRLTVGDEVLRTEIFKINNGRALDGETDEWAVDYQGYNLDELARKVDAIGLGGVVIDGLTLKITTTDAAVSEYHTYVDTKLAELISSLGAKVLTSDNRIEFRRREGET